MAVNYVKGIPDLKKEFMKIRTELRGEGAASMAQSCASLFAREARKRVREKSGNVKKAIGIKRMSAKDALNAEYITHVRSGGNLKNDAYYAHMLEYGTVPHDIKAGSGRANRARKKALALGGSVVVESVSHPGARPHPFMRPAFDENYDKAIRIAEKRLKRGIEKKGWAKDAAGDETL